ncbi:MAG: hypothetical protein PHX14_08400 [Syntrophomonadaceae bacterium]|nr:hypothetical protein [Syntrophomonadaceae bacterium]
MLVNCLIIFALNALSTCLGTLKTLFLSRQVIKPAYITTFLDALIIAYAFKLVAESSGISYIFAFAAGRIAGIFLGNLIENKLALGLLEVSIYKHPPAGKVLADRLRDIGYSVTTSVGYGMEGKERLILNIILPRKQFPHLQERLEQDGHYNMSVKSVNKAYGKIGTQHIAVN